MNNDDLLPFLKDQRGRLIDELVKEENRNVRAALAAEAHRAILHIDEIAKTMVRPVRPIEAIVAALKKRGEPMTIEELTAVVSDGNAIEAINVARSVKVFVRGTGGKTNLLKETEDGKIRLGEWAKGAKR